MSDSLHAPFLYPRVSLLRKYIGLSRHSQTGCYARRKLVVIESDGWGSIRMPSRAVYERCLKAGYEVDQQIFERYDSLLSEDDLELLFGLLGAFRDRRGRAPVITVNTVTGNPNFDAIAADRCAKYHWEPLSQTFARYPRHGRALELWQRAMQERLIYPQFHGREHLNVALFMNRLQALDPDVKFAFGNRMPGCIPKGPRAGPNAYLRATYFCTEEEKRAVLQHVLEGLEAFEAQFGFRARCLAPPHGIWSEDFNKPVARAGIEAFQGAASLQEPGSDGTLKLLQRQMGARNQFGQRELVRNVAFEPAFSPNAAQESAVQALAQIRAAFRKRHPAIIACHRVNFCGFIDPANRDRNLKALEFLLRAILARWPDVEFIHSVELLDLMQNADKSHASTKA